MAEFKNNFELAEIDQTIFPNVQYQTLKSIDPVVALYHIKIDKNAYLKCIILGNK